MRGHDGGRRLRPPSPLATEEEPAPGSWWRVWGCKCCGAGCGLGIIGLAVAAYLYVQLINALFIAFPKPASPADRAAACQGNLREIGQAVAAYRADYDDRYPPAGSWQRALGSYGPTALTWTCRSGFQEPGYRTNTRLGGVRFGAVSDPADTLAAWDAGADVPGHSPVPGARMRRHSGLDNFLFADGSVKALPDGHKHRVDPTD